MPVRPIPLRGEVSVTEELDPKMKIRYLLFSETKGIFLGDNVWSFDEAGALKHNTAHTFNTLETKTYVEFFKGRGITDIKLIEAWPDYDFNLCSPDACANAGLPRWEYDKVKLPLKKKWKKKEK